MSNLVLLDLYVSQGNWKTRDASYLDRSAPSPGSVGEMYSPIQALLPESEICCCCFVSKAYLLFSFSLSYFLKMLHTEDFGSDSDSLVLVFLLKSFKFCKRDGFASNCGNILDFKFAEDWFTWVCFFNSISSLRVIFSERGSLLVVQHCDIKFFVPTRQGTVYHNASDLVLLDLYISQGNRKVFLQKFLECSMLFMAKAHRTYNSLTVSKLAIKEIDFSFLVSEIEAITLSIVVLGCELSIFFGVSLSPETSLP